MEKDANTKCKGSSNKCRRVAQRRVLESAELAPASCEEVPGRACVSYHNVGEGRVSLPPLHQHNSKEIHALCLEKEFVVQVGPIPESEDQAGERDTVALQVPERPT